MPGRHDRLPVVAAAAQLRNSFRPEEAITRLRESSRPWSTACCDAGRTTSISARRSTNRGSGAIAWPASRRPPNPSGTNSSSAPARRQLRMRASRPAVTVRTSRGAGRRAEEQRAPVGVFARPWGSRTDATGNLASRLRCPEALNRTVAADGSAGPAGRPHPRVRLTLPVARSARPAERSPRQALTRHCHPKGRASSCATATARVLRRVRFVPSCPPPSGTVS